MRNDTVQSMRRPIRRTLVLAAVTLSVLAAACASAQRVHRRESEELSDAAARFNDLVRSGFVERAVEFVPAADRVRFLSAQAERERERRFTAVRVGAIDYPADAHEANVVVTWSYYRNDELVERSETVTQRWERKDGRWYVRIEPDASPNR